MAGDNWEIQTSSSYFFLWGVGREMDVRWMGSLSSGGDELGKTWVQYNAKYVKSFLNAGSGK